MKNLIRLISLLLFFSFTLTGCYYDKENELYPVAASCGDTTNITYALSIAPIMANNCNSCHSVLSPSGNVITSTYEGLSVVAKNGKLLRAINWEDPEKTKHMPQGATDTLSICYRIKIKKWVDAGSPNN